MRRLLLVVALLLGATRAEATIYGFTSFEDCAPQVQPTPVDFNFYKAQPTPTGVSVTPHMPLVTTANAITLPGGGVDRCSLNFAPVSGSDHYRLLDTGISGGKTALNVTFPLYITNPGPAGSVCEIMALGSSTKDGAVLTMVSNGTTSAPTLNVYVNDSTTTRCSGSNNNDRACTADSDITDECDTTNPAEAECKVLTAATSITALNSWRGVTLTQSNTAAGTITAGLYEGALNAAYSRSSDAITVGFCATGTDQNEPCNTLADCAGGAACTTTNVPSITQIRLGKTGTGTCAGAWQIGALTWYDGTATPNLYVEALDVASSSISAANTNWSDVGSGHSCASGTALFSCVRDTSSPDDATSAIEDSSPFGSKPTMVMTFATPVIPSASPTPKAIVIEGVGQDRNGSGAIVQLIPQYAGTTTPAATPLPFDFDNLAGSGGASDPYYKLPSSLWERAFTYAQLAGLNLRIEKKAGGSGDTPRISGIIASVLYQLADPPVPTIIPDRDQDGQDTLCIPGDSTFHNTDFQNAVVGNLVEPTNMYFYTRGGSKFGDSEAQWLSMIEGATGGFLTNNVRRGTSGKTCDVILLGHTANTMWNSLADPRFASGFSGVSKGGYCQDDGGADQGNKCQCPDGKTDDWTSNYGVDATRYCLNHGDFKTPARDGAVVAAYCACTTSADCTVGGDGLTATCTSSRCVGAGLGNCAVNAPTNTRPFFFGSGCLNAPGCTNGVCVRSRTPQAYADALARVQALTNARPTPNPAATPTGTSGKPIVVYIAPPEGIGLGCWNNTRLAAAAFHSQVISYAKRNGYPFIDLYARFHRDCDMGGSSNTICVDPCTTNDRACFRDDVHWNQRGQVTVAAGAVTECLTNVRSDGVSATHDGVCTNNRCTMGKAGDSCTTAADCDTWSCDFLAQP